MSAQPKPRHELRGAHTVAAKDEAEAFELEALGWVLVHLSSPDQEHKILLRWCGEGEPRLK